MVRLQRRKMLTIVIVIDVVVIPLLGFIPLLFLTLDHHYYIYISMLAKYSIKCSFGLYILLSVNFPITLSSYFWCMQHIAPLRLCLACSHFPLVCFFASLPLFVSYVSVDFVSLSIMPLKPLCSLLHLAH